VIHHMTATTPSAQSFSLTDSGFCHATRRVNHPETPILGNSVINRLNTETEMPCSGYSCCRSYSLAVSRADVRGATVGKEQGETGF
jgi:hypothetical protein